MFDRFDCHCHKIQHQKKHFRLRRSFSCTVLCIHRYRNLLSLYHILPSPKQRRHHNIDLHLYSHSIYPIYNYLFQPKDRCRISYVLDHTLLRNHMFLHYNPHSLNILFHRLFLSHSAVLNIYLLIHIDRQKYISFLLSIKIGCNTNCCFHKQLDPGIDMYRPALLVPAAPPVDGQSVSSYTLSVS